MVGQLILCTAVLLLIDFWTSSLLGFQFVLLYLLIFSIVIFLLPLIGRAAYIVFAHPTHFQFVEINARQIISKNTKDIHDKFSP